MLELIENYLLQLGMASDYSLLISGCLAVAGLILFAWISLKLASVVVNGFVVRVVSKTKNDWDDKLQSSGFFRYAVHLVPVLLLSMAVPQVFGALQSWQQPMEKALSLYLILVFLFVLNAFISACSGIYNEHDVSKRVPLIGIFQITRLVITIICILLIIAVIMDKSPAVILSGIGALTAILLLVFKDTIQGLVAGIQIAANKMLAHGDWLEMPAQGVDGTVIEVGLNTVKVRNWDNTISFLPTYTLISQPYKNWRGMEESAGRRFKRRMVIDPDSINVVANSDHKTNLAAFRAEISEYLRHHNSVNQQLTQLVRIVNPDQYGIHLEIYFFITDKRWVYFEQIAAEIYEDLILMMKQHELKICTIKSIV